MVTISNSTIRANVFETVYDLLNAYSSWVVEPTVTAAYIDKLESLPQVVIHSAEVDDDNYSFGQLSNDQEVRIRIDVYTKKTKDLDQISDDVNLILKSNIAGLSLVGRGESNAFETDNQNKLKLKTMTYTFIRR